MHTLIWVTTEDRGNQSQFSIRVYLCASVAKDFLVPTLLRGNAYPDMGYHGGPWEPGSQFSIRVYLCASVVKSFLMPAGVTETTFSTAAIVKFLDDGKFCLHHRDHHQLCNSFADFDAKAVAAAIPAGDKQLSLVV